MLNKLIEGRFLDLPRFDNTPPAAPAAGAPAHFLLVPNRNYAVAESEGSGFLHRTRTSAVAPARTQHPKAHRNFRWLPWIPGKISYLPLAGSDILTGPFTGCWAVIFRMGGVQYLGHIGTDTSPGHPNSVQAKTAWTNAVNAGQVVPQKACNPASEVPLPLGKPGAPTIYAVATAGGGLSTLVMLNRNAAPGGTQEIGLVRPGQGAAQPRL